MIASDIKVGDNIYPKGRVTKIEETRNGWRRFYFGENTLTVPADSHHPVTPAGHDAGYGDDFGFYT